MVLERNGGPVDVAQLESVTRDYQIDVEECIDEICNHPSVIEFERMHKKSFNPNSTVQLRELFFGIIGIKPTKETATGAWSIDKEVLQSIVLFGMMYLALAMAFIMDAPK